MRHVVEWPVNQSFNDHLCGDSKPPGKHTVWTKTRLDKPGSQHKIVCQHKGIMLACSVWGKNMWWIYYFVNDLL
jgi:hypothetical protein